MTKCRLILHSGYYPETWNHRHIHSLHKNDSKKDPSNNRGITLGSALGKLYRWLTCNRIGNEIESKNILLPSQAGFGKNYRTTGHKFTLFSLIKKALSKRKYLYTYLVDFRKAYDSYVKNLLLRLKEIELIGKNLVVLTRNEAEQPETSQNELKWSETTRNQPKRHQKICETTRTTHKIKLGGNLKFSTSFGFSNFKPKYPNLSILGQKVLNF